MSNKRGRILTSFLIIIIVSLTIAFSVASVGPVAVDTMAADSVAAVLGSQKNIKISVEEIADQIYTGKKIKPALTVTGGKTTLKKDKDYTLSYKNNTNPGKATVTVTFKGKYAAKEALKVEFNIVLSPVEGFDSYARENLVELFWNKGACSSYQIKKYNAGAKKWTTLATVEGASYTDKAVTKGKTYKYRIRPVFKTSSKTVYGEYVELSETVRKENAKVYLATARGKVTVSWDKDVKASSFTVYRIITGGQTLKKLAVVSAGKTSYTDKTPNDYVDYTYYIVTSLTLPDGTVKTYKSETASSQSMDALMGSVKLKKSKSFTLYDTQGSKTKVIEKKLTSADINTIKRFARSHFKSTMTAWEKAKVALDWIHKNVTYASSDAAFSKISCRSYVDAIFNMRLGTCCQYNGAVASVMAYLGFDVRFIRGYYKNLYSGHTNQHYWTEVNVGGLTYVMEAGNYKRNGSGFYHFFDPYKNTKGYVKNGKYVAGTIAY